MGCDATFSSGYRAYHPHDMFILNHLMWWRRGPGGPSGTHAQSNDDAGQPPAPLEMTNRRRRPAGDVREHARAAHQCSIALYLHVNVKTTNGWAILGYIDALGPGRIRPRDTGHAHSTTEETSHEDEEPV